jgi:hypothetical protein
MPIHDWTRVSAGTWHDFHLGWVAALQREFNCGLLDQDHYAQIEPNADETQLSERAELPEVEAYSVQRRTVVVRHNSGDRIVALIELVSPGNKGSHRALELFVEKAQEARYRGYHLLVVDLFPPTVRDPNGMHGAIWAGLSEEPFELPAGEPLALAAYSAGPRKTAYIEPTAVGRALIDMPLFLRPEWYVNVPLQATYDAALRGVPKKYKQVLEAPPGA